MKFRSGLFERVHGTEACDEALRGDLYQEFEYQILRASTRRENVAAVEHRIQLLINLKNYGRKDYLRVETRVYVGKIRRRLM